MNNTTKNIEIAYRTPRGTLQLAFVGKIDGNTDQEAADNAKTELLLVDSRLTILGARIARRDFDHNAHSICVCPHQQAKASQDIGYTSR